MLAAHKQSKFGWCLHCTQRTGQRRFRELNSLGYCQDCCRKYFAVPLPVEEITTPKTITFPTQPIPKVKKAKQKTPSKTEINQTEVKEKKVKKIKEKTPKPISEIKIARLEEEKQLLEALEIVQVGGKWREAIANYLNWPLQKLRKASRRLTKKGIKIPSISMSDLILELLQDKPHSTVEELAQEMPIKKDWIYQILSELVKSGKVEVKKDFYRNKPNRYSVTEKKHESFNS